MENKLFPCPMRHEDGNCLRIGGDCSSVPRDVCAAAKNAYENGVAEGIRRASPANPPLTLEQLREMDGEPVYLVYPSDPSASHWEIIYLVVQQYDADKEPIGDEWVRMTSGASERAADYGKTWLAYARKPEKEDA